MTLLQLAQAFGAIANGGLLITPNIEKRGAGDEPQVVRRVISEQTSVQMRSILAAAVQSGTGNKAGVSGVDVAGKTGTAQRARPDGSGYAEDENVA